MNIKMKELPISERPYEKLKMYGAEKLTNSELLAIIIKSGTKEFTALDLAKKVLKLNDNHEKDDLSFLQDISIAEFTSIKGIGEIKAIQLLAVCELVKRINKPINKENIKIKDAEDVAKLLMNELKYEKREVVKLILLNNKNIILKIKDISYGGTNFAMIEPKEILSEAIKIHAPKIILVHNHPSGDATPSKADYNITDRIYEASEILGVEFLDHIIIGNNKYESILRCLRNKWNSYDF